MLFQTSVLAALAASASAHLVLNSPVPFEWEDSATQQSPLEPSDFPCKQPGGTYAIAQMNTVAAGDSLEVQIKGGATHGGGSCQFSITTDPKPNKDSQWKVLHSQIHGCVGGPNNDNMSGDRNDLNNPKIPVKIPENLPAGQYTFAWSWFNKLGNREFYMNCAPLEVTSGNANTASADISSVIGSLPDMFVANLPPTECEVASGQDFNYPNPGDSVATGEGAMPGTAISGAGCAAMTVLGAGAGKLGAPAQATGGAGAPAASEPAATEPAATPVASAAPSNGGGIFAPGASSGTAPTATAPAATAPAATQPAATQPAASQPSSPSGGNASSGSCTPCDTDGAVVCIGTDSFGLCNFGCAVAQKLADGMTCSAGAIIRRDIKFPRAAHHKRHVALHKRLSSSL